jgi:hypothetical protein
MGITSRITEKAGPAVDQLVAGIQTRTVVLVLLGVLVGLVAGVMIARLITPGAPAGL